MVEAQDIIARAREFGGPAAVLLAGISGLILTFFELWIDLIDAAVGIFLLPLEVIGAGSAGILDALLGGARAIIFAGAVTTQQAFLPGSPWAVGPLAFGLSVLAAGFGIWGFAQILQIPATSDIALGTFTDLDLPGPLDIGAEEEEDN